MNTEHYSLYEEMSTICRSRPMDNLDSQAKEQLKLIMYNAYSNWLQLTLRSQCHMQLDRSVFRHLLWP